MGFSTLLDILGAMTIGGILVMNLLNLTGSVIESESHANNDKNLQIEVVNTARMIEWDFNKIGFLTNKEQMDSGSVEIADSHSIAFYSDILNGDGVPERISYYIGPINEMANTPNPRDRILYRRINNDPPYMVSNRIIHFNLQYFDTFRDTMHMPIAQEDLNAITFISVAFKVEDPSAYSDEFNEAYWKRLMVTTKKTNRN